MSIMKEHELPQGLIHVSTPLVLLTMVPLLSVAWISWWLELHLESPLLVGTFRTFVQLSILSIILDPIFVLGTKRWYLVMAYCCFMILLAANEGARRTKYHIRGQFWFVFAVLGVNVTLVSLFAFGIILRPDPLWEPQYVIPILGMLLGNCINGVALSLNAMLTSLVESSREIELYLSYGANKYESTSRILREAVRIGSIPQLNGMAIIGLISIPGMMTGQILGGSPVKEAARYQILITYFIAMSSFGAVVMMVCFIVELLFDKNCLLRLERLTKRKEMPSFLERIHSMLGHCFGRGDRAKSSSSSLHNKNHSRPLSEGGEIGACVVPHDQESMSSSYSSTLKKGGVAALAISSGARNNGTDMKSVLLEASNVSCSFEEIGGNRGDVGKTNEVEISIINKGDKDLEKLPLLAPSSAPRQRFLFHELDLQVSAGEIALVTGPSGVGKTTLFRVISGLTPPNEGTFRLGGIERSSATGPYRDMTIWRQHVRYVSQSKLDIPGTPREFLCRIASFQVWKKLELVSLPSPPQPHPIGDAPIATKASSSSSQLPGPTAARYETLEFMALELLESWGMKRSCLDSEWSTLSGGEAQRVQLAMALASRPRILLLDECTSALDLEMKIRVEQSIVAYCRMYHVGALWITHDVDQMERLRRPQQQPDQEHHYNGSNGTSS